MGLDSLILGTRGSALARWQADHVKSKLEARGHAVEIREITTKGDRILDVPLAEIGDKGLFTKELDVALLEGRIHVAVHSLKDLPTRLPEGLALAAIGQREEPWDAFVAHPDFGGVLTDLPEGATLATSSLRRQAQLKAWRPDLEVVPVRGNVDTRLAKLDAGAWHGLVLAAAGLLRLGRADRIRMRIPQAIMLPAVGQGALGIVCAEVREDIATLLCEALHHSATAAAVQSERAFLRRLEGGCQVPIGAHAVERDGSLTLEGCVAALDGSLVFRDQLDGSAEEAQVLGCRLAEALLEQGAGRVLASIRSGG